MTLRRRTTRLRRMRVVTLRALKIAMRALAQIDAMLEHVGIGMTFFAQRICIRNRFVVAGRFIEPADLFARQALRQRMTNFAADVAPICLRNQDVAFRDSNGWIRCELARNAIRRRIDLGCRVPILRRMTARAIGVGTFA